MVGTPDFLVAPVEGDVLAGLRQGGNAENRNLVPLSPDDQATAIINR